MTLVEVMVASFIFCLVSAGIVSGLIQSRRLTEGSNAQASAQAAVESYMEQIENMNLSLLITPLNGATTPVQLIDSAGNPTFAAGGVIPTQLNSTTNDALVWSDTGTPGNLMPNIPDLSALTPGVTPATVTIAGVTYPSGIVDNFKEIPFNPRNQGQSNVQLGLTAAQAWQATWPNALSWSNPNNTAIIWTNTLHMNIWVWVTPLSPASPNISATNLNAYGQAVYGITIIYTWQFWNGFATQYFMGTLHSIRSPIS